MHDGRLFWLEYFGWVFGLIIAALIVAAFLLRALQKPDSLLGKIIAAWLLCLLFIGGLVLFELDLPYALTLVVFNLFLFFLPLTFISVSILSLKTQRLGFRILKWGLYWATAIFIGFWAVFLQPGQGQDFDGAMESSDACHRAYTTVFGERKPSDSTFHMDDPKMAGFELAYTTFYWTKGEEEVMCRANHYLRRVTKFKVSGESKLHEIEKAERAFKRF